MKKYFFLIFIFIIFSSNLFAEDFEVPKNIKIISQSCTFVSVFITVIDLSNNEIVLLEYGAKANGIAKGKLVNVIRTGMFANPEKQSFLIGDDAPKKSQRG